VIAHALVLLAGLVAGAAPRPLPPAVVTKINHLFSEYERPGSPGFAVGVVSDGKLVFSKGYGLANLDYDFEGQPMLWFSGKDLDSSTSMARLPGAHLTVICLSNLPKADAEGKARQVLSLVLAAPGR